MQKAEHFCRRRCWRHSCGPLNLDARRLLPRQSVIHASGESASRQCDYVIAATMTSASSAQLRKVCGLSIIRRAAVIVDDITFQLLTFICYLQAYTANRLSKCAAMVLRIYFVTEGKVERHDEFNEQQA